MLACGKLKEVPAGPAYGQIDDDVLEDEWNEEP